MNLSDDESSHTDDDQNASRIARFNSRSRGFPSPSIYSSRDSVNSRNRLPLSEDNRRILPTMLALLFLITMLIPRILGVDEEKYRNTCALAEKPTVYLQQVDEGSGEFIKLNSTLGLIFSPHLRNDRDESSNTTNLIQGSGSITVGNNNVSSITSNTYDSSTTSTSQIFPAKECVCAGINNVYCLIEYGDLCGVPRDPNDAVGCFHLDSKTKFIQNAWPVVLLWYGALLVFLMATENGKNARYYLVSLCFKSRNMELADQIVAREIQLREQMRIASMTQQRRVLELAQQRRQEILNEIEGNNPTLILKTTRFCKATHNNGFNKQTTPKKRKSLANEINRDQHCKDDIIKTPEKPQSVEQKVDTPATLPTTPETDNGDEDNNNSSYIYNYDEDEDVTCTICIGVINDGDKVGVLPCNHLFHSSCLKEWIKRRNVCPLCQEPDIATPQNQLERRNSATESRMLAMTRRILYSGSDDDNEENGYNIPIDTIAVRRSSNGGSRGPLRINTNLDASNDSPIPPSIPRASRGGNSFNRRVQRLTLNESGEVEFTAVARSPRRRDPRVIRGRGIALAIEHRNRHRRSQRNNRRRGTNH